MPWGAVKGGPPHLGPLTTAATFSFRVPSAQLDQALEDQALLDLWGLSTLDPSTRGLQEHPHSEYSLAFWVVYGLVEPLAQEGQALSQPCPSSTGGAVFSLFDRCPERLLCI